jgi:hypothetical protein
MVLDSFAGFVSLSMSFVVVVVVDSASKRREQTDLGASSEGVLWTTGKGRRFGLQARCVVFLAVVGE